MFIVTDTWNSNGWQISRVVSERAKFVVSNTGREYHIEMERDIGRAITHKLIPNGALRNSILEVVE